MSAIALLSRFVASSIAAGCLLAPAVAAAVTITNREASPRTITIVEGGVAREHLIKPAEKLENVCPKGCVVRLGAAGDGDWELTGDELISIEDGFLYYDPMDGQPVPGASGPSAPDGASKQPQPKKPGN